LATISQKAETSEAEQHHGPLEGSGTAGSICVLSCRKALPEPLIMTSSTLLKFAVIKLQFAVGRPPPASGPRTLKWTDPTWELFRYLIKNFAADRQVMWSKPAPNSILLQVSIDTIGKVLILGRIAYKTGVILDRTVE
jgi:hypothetical protein